MYDDYRRRARVAVARMDLDIEIERLGLILRGHPHPGQKYRHGWIPITPVDLQSLSDDELLDRFAAAGRGPSVDEDAIRRIDAELARREGDPLPDIPKQRRADELIAKGWSYRDAYAEAHDLNPDDLAREELAAMVDAQKQPGETREHDAEIQRAERLGRATARAGRPLSPCPFDANGDTRLLALRFVRGYLSERPDAAVDYAA